MRVSLFALLALSACAQFDPEDPPDRWTEADAACVGDGHPGPSSEVSEACVAALANDFGDPDGVLFQGELTQLRLGVDPYLYDLEAFYVEGVRWAVASDPWWGEGHAARWEPADQEVVVYIDGSSVFLASTLAHETGHARPRGRAHVTCRAGQFAGEDLCDRWPEGAISTELWFLGDAHFPGLATEIAEQRDRVEAEYEP